VKALCVLTSSPPTMATQAQTTDTTAAAEQPSFLQTWFQSLLNPCCKADIKNEDVIVGDVQDLADSVETPPLEVAPKGADNVPILVAATTKDDVVTKYKIDNSVLNSGKRPGIAYRASKSLDDKLKTVARFGEIVDGVDEGDDWLRVGEHFLPMKVNGVQVITLLKEEETFSPQKGVPPSPARAAAKGMSSAVSPHVDKVVEEPIAQASAQPEGGAEFSAATPQKAEREACADIVMADVIQTHDVMQEVEEPTNLIPEPLKEVCVMEKAASVAETPKPQQSWRHRPSVGTWLHTLPLDAHVEA